jgi:transcriptional regulator with PAS, ATPase and Fis domain
MNDYQNLGGFMQNGLAINELKSFEFHYSVVKSGVRLGDEFIFDIFQKNKRFLKMNRTHFYFYSGEDLKIDFQKNIFTIPTYNKEELAFEIFYMPHIDSEDEVDGRFILKSLNTNPFRINGVWSLEAFLERGDIIELGMNKLIFQKEKSIFLETNITSEIVQSSMSILIEGETGTGKTRLAKKIHDESGVAGDFVHLNLSSFSPSLVESELFGHVKGAFTGAVIEKRGAILEANRGTLFLDEIDSISKELQTKLLLFLENLTFRQVGGERQLKSQVRLIFASGSTLENLVYENKMRNDFYFRLISGHKIILEPLRKKRSQIRDFCEQFEQRELVVISEELKTFYEELSWPGNIRQLKSHLQKKKILSNGKKLFIDDEDRALISSKMDLVNSTKLRIIPLEEFKNNYAFDVYHQCQQSISVASTMLKVCPNTLRSILKKRLVV